MWWIALSLNIDVPPIKCAVYYWALYSTLKIKKYLFCLYGLHTLLYIHFIAYYWSMFKDNVNLIFKVISQRISDRMHTVDDDVEGGLYFIGIS